MKAPTTSPIAHIGFSLRVDDYACRIICSPSDGWPNAVLFHPSAPVTAQRQYGCLQQLGRREGGRHRSAHDQRDPRENPAQPSHRLATGNAAEKAAPESL